ncbi:PREDICTED: wiskott-Aldrich syndrome protein homolog 1-like isoform X2 [Priapulus caudatus]|uniref:Wiskott-Aldrich syndrome protein homolog 1-like isoform X2 n=1 Tax=Priapulus caudatus TaxID=37621 RepID=A0ABM1DQ07_PRICU|nr:PREDICTED: wiskott-Aldrich syndrome protein homolog 1-like isoform X2 [Priapulus caudatus]
MFTDHRQTSADAMDSPAYQPISEVVEDAAADDTRRRIPTWPPQTGRMAGRRQLQAFARGSGLGPVLGATPPPPGAGAPVPIAFVGSGRGRPQSDVWSRSTVRRPPPSTAMHAVTHTGTTMDAVTQTTCEVRNCTHPVHAMAPRSCPWSAWHEPSRSTPPLSMRQSTPHSPPPPYEERSASAGYPPPPPRYATPSADHNDDDDGDNRARQPIYIIVIPR